MEEKIKVTYQGKVHEAIKNGDSYIFKLPTNGSLYGTISKSDDGWMLMERDSENYDHFLRIKLRADGRVELANEKGSQLSLDKYDPEYTDMGTFSEPTKNLYYIAKQLEGYDKLGVSPLEILELRYKMMGMALKMLGYQSVSQVLNGEPNPDVSVMDLNRTVQFIEQYPAFAQYVTKGGSPTTPTIDTHVSEEIDKEKFIERFEKAKQSVEEEEQYYNSRAEFFADIRHPMIKDDFCLGMKNNIKPDEWRNYSATVKKLGKLILQFNSDLLPIIEKMRIVQGDSLDQESIEHQISLVTQVPEMDEALAIESYYFMAQTANFEEKIQQDLDDERTRNSTPGKVIKQFVDEVKTEAEDRRKGIERRDYYRNVYPYDKTRRKVPPKKKDEEYVFGDN